MVATTLNLDRKMSSSSSRGRWPVVLVEELLHLSRVAVTHEDPGDAKSAM